MTLQPHIAEELLGRAHSPETAEQLFIERIKHKPLFLRPTSPTPADNRSRRRLHRLRKKEYFYRKQKPRPLSAKEKRVTGIYDLPKEECKYEIFKGLHKLWVEYMQEILDLRVPGDNIVTSQSHGSRLASADFHGAEIEVVRSRSFGRVGLKGIVVRDTKFTFVIVTKNDEAKTIPKEHSIFRVTVPLPKVESNNDTEKPVHGNELIFEIHGSQFENRPIDRTTKKFKWKNLDYV